MNSDNNEKLVELKKQLQVSMRKFLRIARKINELQGFEIVSDDELYVGQNPDKHVKIVFLNELNYN